MRLLDLFCGAGGAGMGYFRAGFEVVGVDIYEQPNYPFEFHWADAMDFPLDGFDVIHASPPCQAYSRATQYSSRRPRIDDHDDLLIPVKEMLEGRPHVIETVQEGRYELDDPVMLCGTMFGIPATSHRYFEVVGASVEEPGKCNHQPGDVRRDHGRKQPESVFRRVIGCEWMTVAESRQAILPAYTEWIGQSFFTGAI